MEVNNYCNIPCCQDTLHRIPQQPEVTDGIEMRRVWAMPNSDTSTIKPVNDFIKRWLKGHSIDPFARNCSLADITNDLNPGTNATHHLDVLEFLKMLEDEGCQPNTVIFDPPFSPRQIKECYEGIGLKMGAKEALRTSWSKERDCINRMQSRGDVVLSFGWNSVGMGRKRGYSIAEILLICHGPGHNDTICMAEVKE